MATPVSTALLTAGTARSKQPASTTRAMRRQLQDAGRAQLAPSLASTCSWTSPTIVQPRPLLRAGRPPGLTDWPRGAFAVRDAVAERARNHSAIPAMCGSKSPDTERLSSPARSAVRFSKSCAVPPGAITSEPFGASIHAPPTKKLIVPSITKKTSSSKRREEPQEYKGPDSLTVQGSGVWFTRRSDEARRKVESL